VSKLVYSMLVSLDGYVATPDHGLEWALPDDELHRVANDEERETELTLYGRRMWETMAPHWSVADQDESSPEYEREFARIWQAEEKVVFSQTLDEVSGNTRLVREDPVEEIRKLKAQHGGPISIGGPTLAAGAIRAGLVDEYQLFLHPVVLGGGLPFLPSLDEPFQLTLADEQRFASGVTYLTYVT
jgi:dihydrofolate reductase